MTFRIRLVALLHVGLTSILLAQTPKAVPGKPLQTMVWVNSGTRVYHCPGSQHFGTTRAGEYMTEAAARGRGDRAAQGTGCPTSAVGQVRLVPLTPGEVWINAESGLYHCPDSRLYGLTRRGRFLPEAEARSAGSRPAGRRECR